MTDGREDYDDYRFERHTPESPREGEPQGRRGPMTALVIGTAVAGLAASHWLALGGDRRDTTTTDRSPTTAMEATATAPAAGEVAEDLWRRSATAESPTLWNNDWDGSGLVVDDFLFEGGENSQFHAVKLNRAYAPDGKVMGLDQVTGAELWSFELPGPTWQSPVVVDDVLIQGDCSGVLHGYDVSDPRVQPPEIWSVAIGGCIESTPTVWNGRIYVGTRGGRFFSLGDDGSLTSPTASAAGRGGGD